MTPPTRYTKARSRAEVQRIVASISELRILSTCDAIDGTITPDSVWRMVASYDAVATSTFDLRGRSNADLIGWLQECVQLSGVSTRAFLSLGGFGEWWIEVEFHPDKRWISSLWSAMPIHEFLLLASHTRSGVGITEEEHDYRCYPIRVIPMEGCSSA